MAWGKSKMEKKPRVVEAYEEIRKNGYPSLDFTSFALGFEEGTCEMMNNGPARVLPKRL